MCASKDFAGDMLFVKQSIAMLASQFSIFNGSQCTQVTATYIPSFVCMKEHFTVRTEIPYI